MNKSLRESIKHWEAIVRGEEPDMANETCPLCYEYDDNSLHLCENKYNEKCPVYRYTGVDQCRNTPWITWNQAQNNLHRSPHGLNNYERVADTPLLIRLAQEELNFLKCVLTAKVDK